MVTSVAEPVQTISGVDAWRYLGADERGRELEIIAINVVSPIGEQYLLVIHAMPTRLRG